VPRGTAHFGVSVGKRHVQAPARKMHRDGDAVRGETFRTGHRDRRARSGPARERDSYAPLPDDKVESIASCASEFDVRPVRKAGVRRNAWAEAFDVTAAKVSEQYSVWIAGVCHGDGDSLPVEHHLPIAVETDDAHVDRHEPFAVTVLDRARALPRVGLETNEAFAKTAGPRDSQGDAPHSVAAHFGYRAICIDDAHANVAAWCSRRQKEKDSVGTDPEVTVT